MPSVTLSQPLTLRTGEEIRGIIQGDLNADGRPDLVVANRSSDTVSVLLNDTPPSESIRYTTPVDLRAGDAPTFVNLADMNLDGKLDVVVSNGNSNTLAIYLNRTTGDSLSFRHSRRWDFALDHNATAIADYNGDGRLDVACVDRERGLLTVFRNDTRPGSFRVRLTSILRARVDVGCRFVVAGDLNNDGRPDLALSSEDVDTVSILLNRTLPESRRLFFSAPRVFDVGDGPRDLALADLDGDGWLDLIVNNQLDTSVTVLFHVARGLTERRDISVPGNPRGIALADLDGDDRLDLVVTLRDTNDVAILLAGDDYEVSTLAHTAREPIFPSVADVNGDGLPDVLVGCRRAGATQVFVQQ